MRSNKRINVTLWIVQGILALFFIGASGGPKLLLPQEMLGMWLPLPQAFMLFIGVAEVLGGLGLILPGVTRIRTGLTPLAALGLATVALCGSVYEGAGPEPTNAMYAFVIALLAASVAYGRWRLVPLNERSRKPALAPAC